MEKYRNRFDAICLGELLIDLVSIKSGVSLEDAPSFVKAAGGAPANVAVGLARLGVSAAFIGKVGNDAFGRFLAKTLKNNEVDTTNLLFDHSNKTKLAFVSLTEDGERDFEFYGEQSADTQLRVSDINQSVIKEAKIFHFGSISLISNPSREATLEAARMARDGGVPVSFDPNLRLSLWKNPEEAKARITEGLKLANIVKMNAEELKFITDKADIESGARILLQKGVKLVSVSLGRNGCYFASNKATGTVGGFDVEALDTTGAGDGFVAGMLAGILKTNYYKLDEKDLYDIFRFANAVGALTTTKRGSIPALPYKEEVEKFIAKSTKTITRGQ